MNAGSCLVFLCGMFAGIPFTLLMAKRPWREQVEAEPSEFTANWLEHRP